MATGFCPYLLQHIGEITKDANPMYKVQPPGLVNMLLTAGNPNNIRIDSMNGHKKSVQVKYRPRFTVDQTDTAKACDQTIVPSYSEATVSLTNTRQFSFQIDDETMAKYCDDATKTVALGLPPTSLMNDEIMGTIMSAANALLQGVDQDLWALINWGHNNVLGTNGFATVNFPVDVTLQPLNNGITKLLADYAKTFLTGRPQVVGAGLAYNYFLQQFAKNTDIFGLNSKIMAGALDFWFDQNAESVAAMGANKFGIFEPGSIQLVEYMEYRGFKAGPKPGASVFGILPLPIQMANDVVPVNFDFQLRYYDCATTITDAYTGGALTIQKGYQIILSKQFGLFQIPLDAYRVTDPNFFVNGALRYIATNS